MAASANAQTISIDDSGSFSYPYTDVPADRRWTLSSADLGGFDPTGSDKLVLAISGEKLGTYEEISYGGVAMTQIFAITVSTTPRNLAIYYLDDIPASVTNLVVDLSGGNGVGLAVIALSGTQAGFVSPPSITLATSTSITTTDANSLVVAAAVNNNTGGVPAEPPLTQVYSGESGSAGHGSGYQQVPESGTTITPTFTGAEAVGAVEFLAIQPPAGTVVVIK